MANVHSQTTFRRLAQAAWIAAAVLTTGTARAAGVEADAPRVPAATPVAANETKAATGIGDVASGPRSEKALPRVPQVEQRPLVRPAAVAKEAEVAAPVKAGLSGSTVQTLASLAGVLALIAVVGLAVRLVSRRAGGLMAAIGAGGRAPSGLLEVLGRYPVGRGTTLILLKMDRRVLLLSQGGGGKLGGATMTTLAEVTEPEDVASILLKVRDAEGDSMAKRFESMLSAERAVGTVGTVGVQAGATGAGIAPGEIVKPRRAEVVAEVPAAPKTRHLPAKHVHGALRPRLDIKRPAAASMAAKPRPTPGGAR